MEDQNNNSRDITAMTQYQEASGASTTAHINPITFMRSGYIHCRMIVEEGFPVDFLHLEVNQSYEKLTGLKNVTGLRMSEVLPGIAESNPEFLEKHRKVVESGVPDQFEVYLKQLNKWYDISIYRPQTGEYVALFDDVTERKQAELILVQSEERFRRLFENHSAVMLLLDPDTGGITDANHSAAAFYGWSTDELRRMRIQQITSVSPDEVKRNMEKCRTSEQNRFLFEHRRADGSVCNVEVFSNLIHVGEKELLYAIIHDVTERRYAEEALRQSEERFRSLFEGHSAIMMVIDPCTGNIMDANFAAADYYGWSIEELRRMCIQEINTLSAEEVKKEMEKSRTMRQNHFSFRHRRANGSIRDVDVFSNVINISGEELLYSIVHDVTDRKKYESLTAFRLRMLHTAESASVKELLLTILDPDRDEKLFNTLFDAFAEPVSLLDQNGAILFANKPFLMWLTGKQETVPGTTIDSHLSCEHASEWKKKLNEVLSTGERLVFEDEQGERRYRYTIYPVPNKEGVITRLLISNSDITSLNLAENELLDHRIHYRNLFNNMLNGFAYCRMIYDCGRPADFVYEVVNLNFKKLFGRRELEGHRFFEEIADITEAELLFIDRLGRVADSGVAEQFEFHFNNLNRRFDITAYSQQKGYVVLVLKPLKTINTCNWEWNLASGEMIWSDENWAFCDRQWHSKNPTSEGWLNAIVPGDREITRHSTQKAVAGGKAFDVVYHLLDAEGAVRKLRSQGLPVKSDDGVVRRYMGISTDITEYQSEENATLINSNNLSGLLNSCMEPLCSITIDGKILDENNEFRDLYATKAQSLKGHDFHNLFPEEVSEERKKKFQYVFATGEPVHFKDKYLESQGGRNPGAEYIYQISAYPIYEKNKTIESLAVFIVKQDEYNDAEKARRQLDKKYQTLISASPDSIITTHLNRLISSISDIGLEIFGATKKSELIGQPFSTIVYPGNLQVIEEIFDVTLREGLVQNREILLKKKNNSVYSAEISAALIQDYNGAPLSYMIIIRDISQRKIIENELFHAKKLISLGEMASGIAHEIYQPINNIGLMVDKIVMMASKNAWSNKNDIQVISEKIFENIIRAQIIIDNIRSFSSADNNYISSDVNVNKSIRNALMMISEQCKYRTITLDFKPEQERFAVTGNIYKIEQVLFNLVKNSMDALEEKKQLSAVPFEMKILIRSFALNDSVVVSVEDNGIGISEKNMEYIMHPFYTTKESGKGTGLGLSISYGIIKDMNGNIKIKSDPMRGTTVIITLPLSRA